MLQLTRSSWSWFVINYNKRMFDLFPRAKLAQHHVNIVVFLPELVLSFEEKAIPFNPEAKRRWICLSCGKHASNYTINPFKKLGGNAVLVDAEHAFDPAYSKALSVDIVLIVCQPDNGEMALETADRMCRSGPMDLICVDSVSALTPRAEIEGEIGMQQMGLLARLMSQAMRKMSGNASKAGSALIFLNQIGVCYGNPQVTSGGIALKFFASLLLEVRSTGKIKSASWKGMKR